MKGDPRFQSSIQIRQDQRFKDWFRTLRGEVDRDRLDRRPWVEKAKRFHARRYAVDKRKPSFPFPGAADVWPPMTDMIIEQMKSLYMNILLLAQPVASCEAFREEDEYRVPNVETHMEYLVNYRSTGFMKEVALHVDDTLSCGFGTLKTGYRYETRSCPETISKRTLPDELAARIVGGEPLEGQEVLFFNEKAFDRIESQPQIMNGQMMPSTRLLLMNTYDLDPQDKTDQRALDEIIGWMRAGAPWELTFLKRDVVIDTPILTSIMGENLITPAYADDIEDCYHVTHEFWLNEFQVRQRWRDATWDNEATKEMLISGRGKEDPRFSEQGIRSLEAQRQGMNWTQSDKYALRETHSWFDYDNDQVDEKVVVLWSPSAEAPIKVYPYESASQKWPFHITPFERNKRGIWNARGIPERLMDIERELVVQKRAELNRLMISSALTLLVRQGSPAANQAIRWVPGEKIIVQDLQTDIAPLSMPDLSVTFQRQEMIWKTWGESYTGTPNYAISDPLSQPDEPRTAKEIGAIQSQGRAIGITRTSLFRETISSVFQEFFTLWQEYGPDEVWVATTQSSPLKLTQEDLQGAYRFILAPLVGMDDPSQEAQKSLATIQILTQLQAQGAIPPNMALDITPAIEAWLRKVDPRLARKVLRPRTQEELQAMQMEQAQQAQFAGAALGAQAANGKFSLSDMQPGGGRALPSMAQPPGGLG